MLMKRSFDSSGYLAGQHGWHERRSTFATCLMSALKSLHSERGRQYECFPLQARCVCLLSLRRYRLEYRYHISVRSKSLSVMLAPDVNAASAMNDEPR